MAVLGAGYGIDNGDMTDRLTVVVGLLVLPGWLLLSSRCFPEVPARGRVNA